MTSVPPTSATSASVPTVWPTFVCRDADAELRFLVDAFGFTERAVHRGDDGGIEHAELTWGDGGVMVGTHRPDDPCGQPPGGASVHVVVTAPDALHDRAVAAGATVLRPIEDTDYGSRQFVVRDPEGNVWSFGTWYE
ncbi:VOC family protein [Pseudonocardia petroleophila]|uniref:VOC family protein n=1 Tax=Pseudonocardia petroleophila TaxID=37331 RepID=A0A7G7MAX1_9PSEU|nr:VOC family protein [Pseudonocardia petroleophila]QNG49932.1 VOC family protein [Pseudonocardia petroleophila]